MSFLDICGGRLALQRRYYSPSCREFCLSSPRLSLRLLTAVTCTVWLAAYGLFTLCEVMAGRRLPAVGVGDSGLEGSLGSWGGARTSRRTLLQSLGAEGGNSLFLETPFHCWTALFIMFSEICASFCTLSLSRVTGLCGSTQPTSIPCTTA